MPVTYSAGVKTARMTATRDEFAGGTLEVGTTAFAATLFSFDLTVAGGTIAGDTWTIEVDPESIEALATGTAAVGRIRSSDTSQSITGLTVGLSGSGANIILSNLSIEEDQDINFVSGTIQHAADPA